MSSYFDRVEQSLGAAVERRAHRPWYVRLLAKGRSRSLIVLFAVLLVATPAVGAASGWFSFGKPNVPPPVSAGVMFGQEKPGSSQLLALRVRDPAGGPPWGLRLVRTSRDDTCVQLGRVENGQLGSLGIDDAWHDDQRFHPISPTDSAVDDCGSTDAAGYGYVNRGRLGEQASANIYHQGQGTGPASAGCALPRYLSLMGARHRPLPPHTRPRSPGCSADAGRVIFYGLLGPDAVSVTYRKPGGGLGTERTSSGVGAYLLVFPYTEATCYQYSHYGGGAVSCASEIVGGVSPTEPGAVTAITYKDGHTCSLQPSAKLRAAYHAFERRVLAKLGRPTRTPTQRPSARWTAAYRSMLKAFLAREHLTIAQFRDELGPVPSCPAVGWVASKGPKITPAEVATPINVRLFPAGIYGCPNKLHLPQGCNGLNPQAPTAQVPVQWSFKARRAVTTSRSWYEWAIWPASSQTGSNCGGTTFATYTNIHAGQTLRYSQFFPTTCRGNYTITVGFMATAPPSQTDNDNASGGTPGHDGSIIVGKTTFTIR